MPQDRLLDAASPVGKPRRPVDLDRVTRLGRPAAGGGRRADPYTLGAAGYAVAPDG
jgi:hypothetical protein